MSERKFKLIVTVNSQAMTTEWIDCVESIEGDLYYLIYEAKSITFKTMKSNMISFKQGVDYSRFYINEYSGLTLIKHSKIKDLEFHSKVKLGSRGWRELIFEVTQQYYDAYLSALMKS